MIHIDRLDGVLLQVIALEEELIVFGDRVVVASVQVRNLEFIRVAVQEMGHKQAALIIRDLFLILLYNLLLLESLLE
jgi:hypothetical protein